MPLLIILKKINRSVCVRLLLVLHLCGFKLRSSSGCVGRLLASVVAMDEQVLHISGLCPGSYPLDLYPDHCQEAGNWGSFSSLPLPLKDPIFHYGPTCVYVYRDYGGQKRVLDLLE